MENAWDETVRAVEERFPFGVRVQHLNSIQLRDSLEWATERLGPTHFPDGRGAKWFFREGALLFKESRDAESFRVWLARQMREY